MISKFFRFFVLLITVQFSTYAQINDSDVLFTVDDDPVFAAEFLRVYNKNLDLVKDESQKDVDTYLDLFIKYKLKIKEAEALGFDQKDSYKKEFNNYKSQLAKNYLTDTEVTEALVKEAYDRVSYDVNVRHVLMVLDQNSTDTAAVYNEMKVFQERLKNEDFDQLKAEISDGKTIIAEDLGYFSGFKMVYPFETAAFNTPVGEVSNPFRTRFGYHVLKVLDKRKSRGEVTVGHIMIRHQQSDSLVNAEERIGEVYKLLQQGESFENLAKQYSEDQSSAQKGGKLAPFKSGQLSSVEFEDQAFSLNIDEVSKPFKTKFGWHIAKLYDKKPLASFEELRPELEQRVKRDSRSKMITDAFVEKLMQQYKVDAEVDLTYFETIITEDYFKREWAVPQDLPKEKLLLKIDRKELTYNDFARYLEGSQKRIGSVEPTNILVKTHFDKFVSENLLKYHEENLENVNPEYAQIISEYRDGLLLFDLMETNVWNAVKKDTVALKKYYEIHKSNYKWPDRIDAVVASSSDQEYVKLARQGFQNNTNLDSLKARINSDGKQHVMFTSGLFEAKHRVLPENFDFKLGTSDVLNYNEGYHVIHVKEILLERLKTFEEAKGAVISDYQMEFEANWLNDLQNKYKIDIDQAVLDKIKSEINN